MCMAKLFYTLHLMEHEGSVYDKMYEVQLSFGKQVPRVVEGDDYEISLTIGISGASQTMTNRFLST